MRLVKLLIVLLLFTVSVAAQTTTRPSQPATAQPTEISSGSIRGKVVMPNGTQISQAVRITLQSLRGIQDAVFTDNQGQFEFRSLSPGDYTIEVEADRLKFDTTVERVQVFR